MANLSLLYAALAAVLIPLFPAPSGAQPAGGAADPVLVENATVKIRKSDYELELQRLPPDIRPGFANSERRVNDLLRRMLIDRTLAAQARADKLPEQPENAVKLAAEIDRMHTLLKIEQIEKDAGAAFDANRANWETRARELFMVDRSKYATPEQFAASHILFKTETRSREEGKRLADEARAKLAAGADFEKLAREVSEDATARRNAGRLGWFSAAEMDPAFSAGVAKLANVGDVSEPVLSAFGWHLIKLDGRRPARQRTFDEARDEVIAGLRQKFVNDARDAALAKLRNDPTIRAHRDAIDALVIRVDQEAVQRAIKQPGAPRP